MPFNLNHSSGKSACLSPRPAQPDGRGPPPDGIKDHYEKGCERTQLKTHGPFLGFHGKNDEQLNQCWTETVNQTTVPDT